LETPVQQNLPAPRPPYLARVKTTLYILGTLVLFVFALDLLVSSLQNLGKPAAETIIMATSNPFTALFIGLMITAMIQSSSTTTSLVVAFVVSGSITLENAIPIIMGANIGTTITSTIVSLGFINKKKEFRRAVAAGTYHDFFNILTVSILFPLEYYFGFLSSTAQYLSLHFFSLPWTSGQSLPSGWPGFTPLVDFLIRVIPSGFVLAMVSFGLLLLSIVLFRRIISRLLIAGSPERFSRFFFRNTWKSFFWGLLTTATIRSSTITTSVVVPIVAEKIITLRKAAPFILGANVGTTITAFIAATLSVNSTSAINIAIVHFLINFFGVLLFYPVPLLRQIPLGLANRLGRLTLRYRLVGFVYILSVFFFIPFSLIYLNKDSVKTIRMDLMYTNHITATQSGGAVTLKRPSGNKSGEWLMYRSVNNAPEEILVVYKRNNMLQINNEMFLFNKPGYCWDAENRKGKYNSCVEEIIPSFSLPSGLTLDSVYIFKRQYYEASDSAIQRFYISRDYPVILKYTRQAGNRIIETEVVTGISQD